MERRHAGALTCRETTMKTVVLLVHMVVIGNMRKAITREWHGVTIELRGKRVHASDIKAVVLIGL